MPKKKDRRNERRKTTIIIKKTKNKEKTEKAKKKRDNERKREMSRVIMAVSDPHTSQCRAARKILPVTAVRQASGGSKG